MLFSLLEAGAVLCALAYMVLVAREHIACWAFAFVSTALFTIVFFEAALSFSMLLNIYYMVMAGYGYWQWRQPATRLAETATQPEPSNHIHPRPARFHMNVIGIGVLVSALLIGGSVEYSFDVELLMGCLDIVVSVFSVMATIMVAHKVYENWFYWMVINATAVVLYSISELYMSAGLFVIYFVFSIYGWREWREQLALRSASI
jgi:nicotinamide mononucleotide transporter